MHSTMTGSRSYWRNCGMTFGAGRVPWNLDLEDVSETRQQKTTTSQENVTHRDMRIADITPKSVSLYGL